MNLPLKVENLNKNFFEKQVLKNISFEVKENEIFGLIGLNGAGKTTIIKIMLDLLEADSGNVSFFGVQSRNENSRKKICYLPEKFQPSAFLKGREFLKLSTDHHHAPFSPELVFDFCEKIALQKESFDQSISKFSKGMGQKLGLISVFMSQAPLLILDEPMSGLDPKARIMLKILLKEHKEKGKSVFFSSHVLSDIEEICDKIAIIHEGEIIFKGTPGEATKQSGGKTLEDSFLKMISVS